MADPGQWERLFQPAEIAALDLATRLCRDSHALAEELIARLRAHYDARGLAELLLVAGQANMANRVGSAARQLFQSPAAIRS